MPKSETSTFDLLFRLMMAILIIWIVKMILHIDPPLEDILANVPWVAIVFAAGMLYMKLSLISKDVDKLKEDLKDIRDTMNEMKGKIKTK